MSQAMTASSVSTGRPLTGRMVLICFIAFFGVIFTMNFILVHFALTTFGGVETQSSYKAGLEYKNALAAAEAQTKRRWHVDASFNPAGEGSAIIIVTARDAEERSLPGLAIEARLAHPTDKRHDQVLELTEIAPGQFRGQASTSAGQWDLVIDLSNNGQRLFRSKSRVSF
jgi:nitrogen fixation protein FixH